tara:strand:+ start:1935 stop:2672 length:738 start_codon:yes stop_codon:yes gene_type:complete
MKKFPPPKPEHTEQRFWVHQIFGLLGDTELPPLFRDNQIITKKWCEDNNYSYRLWDTKSCNQLVKTYYPEFYELYNSVRYPIMKVDIARFLILGVYGGLYLDMDCYPVCPHINKDVDFAVADTQNYNKKGPSGDALANKPYEIEVLQSKVNNPILTDFIRYVATQIKEKDNIKVYETWKCRYVYQTTGPLSFCRFMKNKEKPHTYKINSPDWKGEQKDNISGDEDFISHISCSYMTKDKKSMKLV